LQDRIEEHLKRAGLPPLDWYDVLSELEGSADGALRQAALQKSTELAQYNVCRLIDRLERDGLVSRKSCPVDARNNVVVITEKGRDLRQRMHPVYGAAVDAHVGQHLTADETRQLRTILAKLKR
jgi:DNA-binding MarR family transcriptional regulator